MFRTCPATGRLMHKFDPATHRCKCGRWERGYAPKKEAKRPRNECQICERTQACVDGKLGHHGYTRPGYGFIVGDCPGVNHLPYPATDALEAYVKTLDAHASRLRAIAAELPSKPGLSYTGYNKKQMSILRGAKALLFILVDGKYVQVNLPGYDDLLASKLASIDNELRHVASERTRVVNRIEAAKK